MKPQYLLITAGTRRLGFAMAQKALSLGFGVVLHYRSRCEDAQQWLEANPQFKCRVHFVQMALEPSNAPELIQKAHALAPELCGLVNNASTFTKGNLEDSDHFEQTLQSNALLPAALSRAFSAVVHEGWIINLTDAHIGSVNLNYQNYRISKLLLTELTRQMALLWAPRIRVNAIAPGAILAAESGEESGFEQLAQQIPAGRTGRIEDIQQAFAYLLSQDYLSGQTLFVDGGWHCAQ